MTMKAIKLLVVVCALVLCCGCRTRYIEVPIEKIRTEYKTQHTSDTIMITDSVKVTQRADTLIIERVRYRDRVAVRTDTVVRTDTLTNTKVIEVPTQRRTPRRFGAFTALFGASLLVLMLYALWRYVTRK